MNAPENSLRNIFAEALEIEDAQQRAAFLSQACGTDSALRREVEELIQAEAAAGKFRPEQPAATGWSSLVGSQEALGLGGVILNVPVTEQPGDRIGRYKLVQKIGERGRGVPHPICQAWLVGGRLAGWAASS